MSDVVKSIRVVLNWTTIEASSPDDAQGEIVNAKMFIESIFDSGPFGFITHYFEESLF